MEDDISTLTHDECTLVFYFGNCMGQCLLGGRHLVYLTPITFLQDPTQVRSRSKKFS